MNTGLNRSLQLRRDIFKMKAGENSTRRVHRYKESQPVVWFDKNQEKSNQRCLYCGALVGANSSIESSKEHLIGRNFVPKGAFEDGRQFNFIFRACKACNSGKSEVEGHLSSVTLFNIIQEVDDEKTRDTILRKASKDYHPNKRGKLVKDSFDELTFNLVGLVGTKISTGVKLPPQANEEYIKFLSFKHIQGLFSLVTSHDPSSVKGTNLLDGKYFWFHNSYYYRDWGNPELIEISKRAHELKCRARIDTANNYFKATLCRKDERPGYWFWALEWNKCLRIVGGISFPDKQLEIFNNLPPRKWHSLGSTPETKLSFEVPISEEEDILFSTSVSGIENT